MKRCSTCRENKPFSHFYTHNKWGYQGRCKPCSKSTRVAYAKTDKAKATRRAKYRERPQIRKYIYRISSKEFEQMCDSQGGVCRICSNPPHPKKRLAIDHCHSTGRIRGLLCGPCNMALGLFKDDAKRLLKAASYLSVR